jgi:hypothetical protein
MRHTPRWVACLAMFWIPVSGCAKPIVARYVYQDGEYGVVGIPVNTYQDNMSFRDQAEELMARHFPEGFEIVRAEEVNEGERILDVGRKTEVATEPQLTALNQVFKLGKLDRTTSYQEKDKLQVRECRIIYRKKPLHSAGHTGQFAAMTSLVPPFYIDPNEVMRQEIKTQMLAKASTATKKLNDPEVRRAAVELPKAAIKPSIPVKPASSSDW